MKTNLRHLALLVSLALSAGLAATPQEQASAALKNNDLATAESVLTPLTTGATPDAAALGLLAEVRLKQKQTKEAITLLERATQAAPTNPDLFAQLGTTIAQRMGEVSFMQQASLSGKMRRAFEKAVELKPDHLDALVGLTRYFSNAPAIAGGSAEKAREFALRVQKVNPYLGEMELGRLDEKAEQPDAALARYAAAGKLDPTRLSPDLFAGRLLAKLKRNDEARAHFQAALTRDPTNAAALKGLADLAQP